MTPCLIQSAGLGPGLQPCSRGDSGGVHCTECAESNILSDRQHLRFSSLGPVEPCERTSTRNIMQCMWTRHVMWAHDKQDTKGLFGLWVYSGLTRIWSQVSPNLSSVSHELVFGFLVNLRLTNSKLCLVACIFDAITISCLLGEVTDLSCPRSIHIIVNPTHRRRHPGGPAPSSTHPCSGREGLSPPPPCVIDLTNQFDCGSYQ